MFWSLVLRLTIAGHTEEYVIDRFRGAGDCTAALFRVRNTHYHETHVTFSCEKTRLAIRRPK